MIGYDAVAVALAIWLSYALRFATWQLPHTRDQWAGVFVALVVSLPIFYRMGLYRAVIRYLPERSLWTMIRATTYAGIGLVIVAFLTAAADRGAAPRSVPVLFWAFVTIFVIGGRFLAKSLLSRHGQQALPAKRIIIYGAGEAGVQLLSAIKAQREGQVVAFLDDNKSLWGHEVGGVRVLPPAELPKRIRADNVVEIILSIPSIGGVRRREIVDQVSGHGVRVRTLPALADIASGKYAVTSIQEIDIDDLLGRSMVPPDRELLTGMIAGRTIMVTGAGGSIGSELCRLVVAGAPQRLILFEANEFALYQIHRELSAVDEPVVVPVLGSVTDERQLRRIIGEYGIEVVFHAAAHKHVPLVEANCLEGIRNNVFGTLTIAKVALSEGVPNFVLISSDKAVRPTNVMGATKRWAELIVQHLAAQALKSNSGQKFCAVRFGNVLGSNGSVVPLFKEQIARGGPVTLTHPEMTRYFMSIHEAAELIVQASALSAGGDIFLLEMGNPILIRDLAENMVRLAGLTVRNPGTPDGDIDIIVTGKRPGEKMFEELFYDPSVAVPTRHPKILKATFTDAAARRDIEAALAELRHCLDTQDEAAARALLFGFIT